MESATGTDDPAGKIHQHTLTEWQPAQMLFKYSYFFLNEKSRWSNKSEVLLLRSAGMDMETIEGASWIYV